MKPKKRGQRLRPVMTAVRIALQVLYGAARIVLLVLDVLVRLHVLK
jgi:hypothetical protein